MGREKDGPKFQGWVLHWTVLEYDVEKNKWQRLNDQMLTGRGTLATSRRGWKNLRHWRA